MNNNTCWSYNDLVDTDDDSTTSSVVDTTIDISNDLHESQVTRASNTTEFFNYRQKLINEELDHFTSTDKVSIVKHISII